jgi:hypothetical protein
MGTDSKPFIYSTESKLEKKYNSNSAHMYAYEGQSWVSPQITCQQKGNAPLLFYSIKDNALNTDLTSNFGYEESRVSNSLMFKFKMNPMVYRSNLIAITVRCGIISQPSATQCVSMTCVEKIYLLFIDKVMSLSGLTSLTFYTNSINKKVFKLDNPSSMLTNNKIYLSGTVQANMLRFSKPYLIGTDVYVKLTSFMYTTPEVLTSVEYKTVDLSVDYRSFLLSFNFK